MIKCEFFQTSNYDYFIKMTKVCKIPSGLISNLENEYLMDIKIKDNEEKIKQEQNKIIWEKENTIKI